MELQKGTRSEQAGNPNRDEGRKEKRVKTTMMTWTRRVTLGAFIIMNLAIGAQAAEIQILPTKGEQRVNSLPFAWDVTQKLSPFWASNKDIILDSVFGHVVIDGEVWYMYVDWHDLYGKGQNKARVLRHKGPDLDHLVRQPDGVANLGGYHGGGFLGVGMWWDDKERILYALVHTEMTPNGSQGWCSKKTRIATSKDLGLTWSMPVDVLTRALPNVQDYAGSEFEAGPADCQLFTDVRGGYFYITCWNAFVAKKGPLNCFMMYDEVARCAIADKMAPGKWFKFRDGTWTEPGLGGKVSRVGFNQRGIYGGTIYSTYLKKYLRVGVHVGVADPRFPTFGFNDASLNISACTDLAKQDWLPMAKLIDEPKNPKYGIVLSDEKGIDPSTCGKTFRAYNYWDYRNTPPTDRVITITLKEGTTPSRYFPPHDSYSYEPHPESGDPIESRKTKIIGSTSPEVRYEGDGWTIEKNPQYFEGQANVAAKVDQNIQFTFQGPSIFWRAVANRDAGKADVYIDGVLEKTVDCFFQECALPYQFAFIKTGLDPKRSHTIKIVTRADKNPESSGMKIRHIAFEYGLIDEQKKR